MFRHDIADLFTILHDRRLIGHYPMEAQTGDRHLLIAPRERIALLLADPLGQTVGVFVICRVLFVERKIVVAWPAAIGCAGGVDARRLADALNSYLSCGAERVIAADHIIVVNHMSRLAPRRWDRRKVDEPIAPLQGLLEIGVLCDIRLNEADFRCRRALCGKCAIDADDAVALSQGHFDDSATDSTAAAGDCNAHCEEPHAERPSRPAQLYRPIVEPAKCQKKRPARQA